jgi:riboflavin biosynthesis pyrimidine reductase
VRDTLAPLGPGGPRQTARGIVEALGLDVPPAGGRPRVVASMIASADGRATVEGSSAGLGHPADRALLRELRTAVDAILVGPATLRAEGYAALLDADQRKRRIARGLEAQPIVSTVTRSGDVPVEVGLFAEPDARIQVYAEAAIDLDGRGGRVAVERFAPGGATPVAVLAHLARERGVRSVLCEGGPTLLRALVAAGCVDDLLITLAPFVVAGQGPATIAGDALQPPRHLALADVHRAGDHLFMHYVGNGPR